MQKNIQDLFLKKNLINGFTLTELLISTSIFSSVAVMGVSILFASQAVYKRISATRNATDNLSFVMEAMTREIRTGTHYGCVNTISEGNFKDKPEYNHPNFNPNGVDDFADSDSCNAIAFVPDPGSISAINHISVFYFHTTAFSLNKVDYKRVSIDNRTSRFDIQGDNQLTSADLVVNNFIAKVRGSGIASSTPPDYLQPSMSIFLSGIINQQKNAQGIVVATSTFNLQTLVSQKLLDK